MPAKNTGHSTFFTKKNSQTRMFTGFEREIKRARDGTRTRGLDLGKVALHQLSHSRMKILLCVSHKK